MCSVTATSFDLSCWAIKIIYMSVIEMLMLKRVCGIRKDRFRNNHIKKCKNLPMEDETVQN